MPRISGKSALCIAFFLIVAAAANAAVAAEKVSVFVSIAPQKTFVQQIGKDLVDVGVMVQPGASPATYEPKPKQMVQLSKAKVYFAIGVPFENFWLEKIAAANPKMKIVHTDEGIEKLPMAAHHHDKEAGHYKEGSEHHPEGEQGHGKEEHAHEGDGHDHGGLDPHIWLSPPLVKKQADTILAALTEIDPDHRSAYEANHRQFVQEIDRLDADLKKTFEGKQGLRFMVFHPSWGYFARAYGLEQVPIEIEGKDPKPAQLKELIEQARESGIKVVFVQPQFSVKSAKIVAGEIGGRVAFADPLAEDWEANLRKVAEVFKEALK